MAIVPNTFVYWQSNYTYRKWDIAYGATSTDTRYFYNLVDNNFNTGPLATFTYTATNTVRTDGVNRMYFTQTGTTYFTQGSMVEVRDIGPDTSTTYSGVCLGGGPGYVDYLNPGLSVTNGVSAGTVRAPLHPYWTTGWAWIPDQSSSVVHEQLVINTQLGDGFSQRFNPVINSNSFNWNLTFDNRTDRETTALLTFLQDKGGATAFVMPFPVGLLYTNPNIKYIAGTPRHGLTAYGLNSVSVPVQMVFDL